ncbi:MAG: hypothetical protein AAF416_18060 [Pseudomonadota bacterium]
MTFASSHDLQRAVIETDHPRFVSRYLFEGVPFIFDGNIEDWISWKSRLGNMLEVDPRNIVLTGSAAIGFSLSPGKNFRGFRDASDIDCGIVSPHHFDLAWRYLRQRRTEWLSLPRKIKDAIRTHRENYIFSGTIDTDSILALLPFGADWIKALTEMSRIPPTEGHQVNLRIYKDFEALRGYQMVGLRDAKARILDSTKDDDDPGIPVEDE